MLTLFAIYLGLLMPIQKSQESIVLKDLLLIDLWPRKYSNFDRRAFGCGEVV